MYVLLYYSYYEGETHIEFNSLEQAKQWLEDHRPSYENNLDNVTIYKIEDNIDVYDLMREG